MSLRKEILSHGLIAEFKDGKILLHGPTSANKEKLKALGASWNPDTRVWTLSYDVNIESLRSSLPQWVCCKRAHSIDAWNKTLVCPSHFPSGKMPSWFCSHENARIVNLNSQKHICSTCNPNPTSYFIRGVLCEES